MLSGSHFKIPLKSDICLHWIVGTVFYFCTSPVCSRAIVEVCQCNWNNKTISERFAIDYFSEIQVECRGTAGPPLT